MAGPLAVGPIAFAGSPLERADHLRADGAALARLMDWRARLLLLDGLLPQIGEDGALAWGTLADARPDAELVFLGLLEGKACFAAVPDEGAAGPAYAMPRAWAAMQQLSPADLAIYGTARSLVDWHARHRFCARCGHPTRLAKGGWQRDCVEASGGCGAQHFPRTDPVTIMLVEYRPPGQEPLLLLGRQPRFPPRSFSVLAGFVEPGETIEEAVAREVHEEVRIRVEKVRYLATQPWPFPSQLMIGCHCLALDDKITLDETELEEARWFSRAQVAAALHGEGGGPFNAPPAAAIAHSLLKWWLEQAA